MKTKNITFLVVFSMLMLTGCDFLPYFTSSSSYSAASSNSAGSSLGSSTAGSDTGDGYYKATSYDPTFADLKYESGYVNLDSVGNQNILVIPVNFTDSPCSSLSGGCSSVKTKIQKTFFGASSETGWESVASFYEASSYGNLHITGTVTDWFTLDKTTTQLAALTSYGDPTYYVLRAAVSWYKTQSGSNLTSFDQNSDGYIDAVWLVYSAPNYSNVYSPTEEYQNTFWAYTYWDYQQTASMSNPVANVYGWASYDFMYDGYGTSLVDAHTYIHETGHVMGLDDYYSYTDGDWGAAGGLDMMDYNVLDHNAYSKMALDWTYPYVIDGTKNSTSLTLNPFESSGDCVLINNSWNGSPLDEYLLLEFYTPTGLNYKDSHNGGYVNGVEGFTVPGIKIYHIDSRMGRVGWSDSAFISFTNGLDISSGSYYTDIVVSNSSEYSIANSNYKLVHLLEAGGTNTFMNNNSIASNNTLFTQGDTFSPTSYANFFYINGKFNDNTSIGYSVSVNSVSSSSASITINRL